MSPTRRDFLKTGLATATSLTLFDGASPVAAAAQAPPVPAPAADAFAVDVANAAFPRPPRPPRATSTRSPTLRRSASGIRSSPFFSYTTVPGGTSSSMSSPSNPVQFEPWPCWPRSALNSGWNR